MKKIVYFLAFIPSVLFSQGYTSFFTGNTTNISTNTQFGVCLMGGATESDNAMRWLLQKANGGDVVVLRSSGSNGYNEYLYSQLGVPINSVETLVITSVEGATNPYVLNKVANAEMIWFAGGNQWNYISFFRNNALEDLINNHVNVKHAPIGGTSAGMAILGGFYFSAENGSVTSSQALNNPYAANVTIGGFTGTPSRDFLNIPFLANVITDTHYDNPDRRGRHFTFLSRIKSDYSPMPYGIACNEYVAVCIDVNGVANVYGDFPNYQEFAYFIQPNCLSLNTIQNCQPGQSLTWNTSQAPVIAYKVPGTANGTNFFNVNNWGDFINTNYYFGGSWENWSVTNGVFSAIPGTGLSQSCTLTIGETTIDKISALPNPFTNFIFLKNAENAVIEIFDTLGRRVTKTNNFKEDYIDSANFPAGLYFVKIQKNEKVEVIKMIKD